MKKPLFTQIEGGKGFYSLLVLLGAFILAALGAVFYMEHNGHWVTGMNNQIVWGMPHVFAIFLIAGFAETNRVPFDLPEAESELVAGYHTEYSGMRFGVFYLGEYANMITVSAIAASLFFGGWNGPILPPVIWFLIKVVAFLFVYVWVRGTLPRFRYDQLMRFGWKVMFPIGLLNIVVTAFIVALKG